MRRLTVALGIVGLGVGCLGGSAHAQAPDAQAWWWVAGSPLAIAPPYVPDDGLYVASNPTGPEAVSALRFTVAGAGGAGTLTLEVAGETRGTPIVGLCVLADEWEPVQGGPLADAPACDPEGSAVPGTVADDGRSVSFPVSSLLGDGNLNLGIVPGTDTSGGNPTFQLAFAKPGPGALTPASSPSTSRDDSSSEPAIQPEFSPSPSPAFAPLPPETSLGIPRPSPPAPTSTRPSASPPGGVAAPVSTTRDDDDGQWRTIGFVLLAAIAVAYHRLSTMPDREARTLIAFGKAAVEDR